MIGKTNAVVGGGEVFQYGVFIQDTTGKLWTASKWDGSATPNGVAVITEDCQFVISLATNKAARIDGTGSPTNLILPQITSATLAMTDFAGIYNTANIIAVYGNEASEAAGYCNSFTFPNGKTGYLGSAGEWQAVLDNKSSVANCLSKCGGGAIDANTYLWSSTRMGDSNGVVYFWLMNFASPSLTSGRSTTAYYTRPFTSLR